MTPLFAVFGGYTLVSLILLLTGQLTVYGRSSFMFQAVYQSFGIICVVLGIVTIVRLGITGPRKIIFSAILAGVFNWVIGDLIFDWYLHTVGEVPYPSFGDIFYFLGYAFLAFGVWREMVFSGVTFQTIPKSLARIIGVLVVSGAGISLLLSAGTLYNPDGTLGENIVNIGYVVGDILLLSLSMILLSLMWVYRKGKILRSYVWFIAGMIFTYAADIYYVLRLDAYDSGVYPDQVIIDSLYILGYVSITLMFLVYMKTTYRMQQTLLSHIQDKHVRKNK